MKRILLAVFAIVIILNLASCATQVFPEAPATVEGVNQDSYEDNLSGLTSYFKDKGYVAGEPTKMSADLIGAKEGSKYQFAYAKAKVSVELYEYDLNNLSDTSNEVLNKVKESGKLTIQNTSVDALISDNGKYLMIYIKDKGNEENAKREQEVINDFKTFKK